MTLSPALSLREVSLADPDFLLAHDPAAVWRLLRREAPVHWTDGGGQFPGFWSLTRYDDVLAVSRDPATFISSKGISMTTNPETAGPEAGLGRMLIVSDPPRHVRLRRLVNKGFTPRAVATFEPHVRQITGEILDAVAERGECDFVTDIAALLPLAVICDMMGVPKADWPEMFELTNKVLGADDPEYQIPGEDRDTTSLSGRLRMFGYFKQLIEERRRGPRQDDITEKLMEAEIEGERLDNEEILLFAFLLIVAGNETTRNAISGGLLASLQHREQWQRLADEPELMPLAVEEIVRWTSPVMHMARTATRDTEVHGQPIRAGERVIMWYPAANRDEAVFTDPETFDVGRTPNDHIAFGHGEHFCLGAGFARLEIRVIFEELLRRFPNIELAGAPERLRSTFIGGIKHMPVRL